MEHNTIFDRFGGETKEKFPRFLYRSFVDANYRGRQLVGVHLLRKRCSYTNLYKSSAHLRDGYRAEKESAAQSASPAPLVSFLRGSQPCSEVRISEEK